MTSLMFVLALFFIVATAAPTSDGPALFNKDQRMDKLILKNQIGYHFKKVVREVSQELFVSRKLDVTTLLHGVNVMEQTAQDLTKYCQSLGNGVASVRINSNQAIDFVYIQNPKLASFAEAKARCEARQLQLPEIYTAI